MGEKPYCKAPKYPITTIYLGFPYQDSFLLFSVDTLHLSTWTLPRSSKPLKKIGSIFRLRVSHELEVKPRVQMQDLVFQPARMVPASRIVALYMARRTSMNLYRLRHYRT